MGLKTYDKINTLYKRYQFDGKSCPNQKWLKFKNKIILGDFSNETAKYLKFSNELFPEAIDAFGDFMNGLLPEVDYET